MTMTQTYTGVDIAKDWIDTYDSETSAKRHIAVQTKSLRDFAKHAGASRSIVVLEASGGYERALIDALEREGALYVRVNPRQAREFARATGMLAKTDQVDARLLAHMGSALALQPAAPRDPACTRLAMLTARREALVETRKQEKQRLCQAHDAFIVKSIKALIEVLSRAIARAEAEIERHIQAHEPLARRAAQLRSVPGIGPATSATLLAKLPELGRVDRRAIANLAGLAPHACDSGHMRGKRMIWGGRGDVRRALYTAAFIASRCDPGLKAYRKKLEAAAKPFKIAIIACARRLLTQINAILKAGRLYEPRPA